MNMYCKPKTKPEIMAGVENVVASKFIARNTIRYETESGDIVTRLHLTDVVIQHPNKSITVHSGGWGTPTTRDRINNALPRPYRVWTEKGTMYISNGKTHKEFKESVYIGPRGKLVSDIDSGDALSYEVYRKKIDSWIAKLLENGIPEDSSGDPWVFPEDSGKYHESYVQGWLDETYVFTTFIANAIRFSGMTDIGVAHWMRAFNDGRDRAYITRKVRRYFRACLGFTA